MGSVRTADKRQADARALGELEGPHIVCELCVHEPVESGSDEGRRRPQRDIAREGSRRAAMHDDVPLSIETPKGRGDVPPHVTQCRSGFRHQRPHPGRGGDLGRTLQSKGPLGCYGVGHKPRTRAV